MLPIISIGREKTNPGWLGCDTWKHESCGMLEKQHWMSLSAHRLHDEGDDEELLEAF